MARNKVNKCPLSFPGEIVVPNWERQHKAILKSERLGQLIACCEMAAENYYQQQDENAAIALAAVFELLDKCMYEYQYHGS